jgi:hypothetical protein
LPELISLETGGTSELKSFAIGDFQRASLFIRRLEMAIARFVSLILRIGMALALAGQLKSCTLELMGLAAEKTERGIMSYSRYTRLLTK